VEEFQTDFMTSNKAKKARKRAREALQEELAAVKRELFVWKSKLAAAMASRRRQRLPPQLLQKTGKSHVCPKVAANASTTSTLKSFAAINPEKLFLRVHVF
jgi:hypothetical protein